MLTLGFVIVIFATLVTKAGAPGTPSRADSGEVAYWHRLAVKRLKLIGKREHRIVALQRRLYALADPGSHGSGDTRVRGSGGIRSIICQVFGSQCSKALSVAWCESRFNVYARNGQYLGLFQMGEYARARYGHGWDAWTQARAARRYYLDAGWSPWACA